MHQEVRVAGLLLRRREGKEFHQYSNRLSYDPEDYEVLLRQWPSEPFKSYLGAFSGPAIQGEALEETLLKESQKWTAKLAGECGLSDENGVSGRRAVFLSVHGGGDKSEGPLNLGVLVGFTVPLSISESSIVGYYPNSPKYPKFYQLGSILRGMVSEEVKVHPVSRELLASLDHWLREQHAIPGAVNALFAPRLGTRIKISLDNPLFAETGEISTPNQYFQKNRLNPLLSSTQLSQHGFEDDRFEYEAVDIVIKNPLYGSGLNLQKANCVVVNKYFGCGLPDYDAIDQRKGKWIVQVKGDGFPDWTEMFPVHKFACEGDAEGIQRCLQLGMDPDKLDTDFWAPLHYACWYGEVGAVKALVEDGAANIAVQNSSGSTPLHLAAATGQAAVVEYLLTLRNMERVKAALDSDGKSPLAVCIEFRMNEWQKAAQLLRDSYKSEDGLPLSPTLLSFQATSVDQLLAAVNQAASKEDLCFRGSQADLTTQLHNNKKKKRGMGGEKLGHTVRRQRVNLMNGQHFVVHFFRGRDTPAGDVIRDLFRLLQLSKEYHSFFALWISSSHLELQIGDTDKPLKLMSAWKQLVTQYSSIRNKSSVEDVPTFQLRRNIFIPLSKEKLVNDPLALQLLYADAQCRVLSGYYPCLEEDAVFLAGISMQVNYGDHNPAIHKPGFLRDKLREVLPTHFITGKRRLELERRVLTEHAQTDPDENEHLYVKYLEQCWQWPHYGATFYHGSLQTKGTKLSAKAKSKLGRRSMVPVRFGVNSQGFHLVNDETNEVVESLKFESVEWDLSAEKHQVVIYRRDHSLHILIHTKQAALVYSLVTRLLEQQMGVGIHGSRTTTNIYAT